MNWGGAFVMLTLVAVAFAAAPWGLLLLFLLIPLFK